MSYSCHMDNLGMRKIAALPWRGWALHLVNVQIIWFQCGVFSYTLQDSASYAGKRRKFTFECWGRGISYLLAGLYCVALRLFKEAFSKSEISKHLALIKGTCRFRVKHDCSKLSKVQGVAHMSWVVLSQAGARTAAVTQAQFLAHS